MEEVDHLKLLIIAKLTSILLKSRLSLEKKDKPQWKLELPKVNVKIIGSQIFQKK